MGSREKKCTFGTPMKPDFFRTYENSPKSFLEKCEVFLFDEEKLRDLKDCLLACMKREISVKDLGEKVENFGLSAELLADLKEWISKVEGLVLDEEKKVSEERKIMAEEKKKKKKKLLVDKEEEKKEKLGSRIRSIISASTSSDMSICTSTQSLLELFERNGFPRVASLFSAEIVSSSIDPYVSAALVQNLRKRYNEIFPLVVEEAQSNHHVELLERLLTLRDIPRMRKKKIALLSFDVEEEEEEEEEGGGGQEEEEEGGEEEES